MRTCQLQDIRPSLSSGEPSRFRLNKQGFTARRYPTALKSGPYVHSSWNDEQVLRKVYVPEIEELVRQVTGGRIVFSDQVVMRTATHTEIDGLARSDDDKQSSTTEDTGHSDYPKLVGTRTGAGGSPTPKVHLDFSPAGARTHLRKYHAQTTKLAASIIEAEDALLASGIAPSDLKDHYDGPRWAMFSVWRPLKPVRRDPLALSDVSTFPTEDYVPYNIRFPTGKGIEGEESTSHVEAGFLAYGSDAHDWYWISNQQPDEVLVIQLFDSEAERDGLGVAGGVVHSSVHLEGTEDEEARESIEVRCTVIW